MTIGFWQVILVLGIVLILFGAGKLPSVMGDMAKGIKSFRAGLNDKDPAEPSSDSSGKNASANLGASPQSGTNPTPPPQNPNPGSSPPSS